MKTALAKKPTELETIVSITLGQVKESPFNHRGDFGDLAELADTMRPPGKIHQALVVRAVEDKKHPFEIVFGHRRFRAAKLAKLDAVPAVVRELTDAEVVEAQLIENLARKDVNAMEEAEGFEQLQKQGKSPDDIADAIGKSKAHVYGRLKLLALRPAGRKALLAGDIPASVALLLARIPMGERQDKAIKDVLAGGGWNADTQKVVAMSVRQAFEHIQGKYMLRLTGAPFRQDDAELFPEAGSCKDCPKRTGNQKHLFDDVKSADVCTDPDCFAEKVKLNSAHQLKLAEEKGKDVVKAKGAFRKSYTEAGKPARYEVRQDGDFVDPKAAAPGGDGKTWDDLLGRKAPEPKLVQDPAGKIHKLYAREEAIEGLRLAGKKAALTAVKRFEQARPATDEERAASIEREERKRAVEELAISITCSSILRAATTPAARQRVAIFALVSENDHSRPPAATWADIEKLDDAELEQTLLTCATESLQEYWRGDARGLMAKVMGVDVEAAKEEAKAMVEATVAERKAAEEEEAKQAHEAELDQAAQRAAAATPAPKGKKDCAVGSCGNAASKESSKGRRWPLCTLHGILPDDQLEGIVVAPAPAKGRKSKKPAEVSAEEEQKARDAGGTKMGEQPEAEPPVGEVDGNGDFPGDAAGQ